MVDVCVFGSVCVSWVPVASQSRLSDDVRPRPLRVSRHAGRLRLSQDLQE